MSQARGQISAHRFLYFCCLCLLNYVVQKRFFRELRPIMARNARKIYALTCTLQATQLCVRHMFQMVDRCRGGSESMFEKRLQQLKKRKKSWLLD